MRGAVVSPFPFLVAVKYLKALFVVTRLPLVLVEKVTTACTCVCMVVDQHSTHHATRACVHPSIPAKENSCKTAQQYETTRKRNKTEKALTVICRTTAAPTTTYLFTMVLSVTHRVAVVLLGVFCATNFNRRTPYFSTAFPSQSLGGTITTTTTTEPTASSPPRLPLPPTWGFNYDHFAPIDGGDGCQFTLADLLALPTSSDDAIAAHLDRDFAAMQQMGGTAVRLYLSLDAVLANATAPNTTALGRLADVVAAAAAHGLAVDLTGANVMRPARVPAWLAAANDTTLRTAQTTFWRSVAQQFDTSGNRNNNNNNNNNSGGGGGGGNNNLTDSILVFNLINEPTIPSTDGAPLAIGCLGPRT